ncbi:hypothetical protein RJT34_06980 [Clitoria ternatea]|uniref:Uncharacterized protein n=1 Tax=Clitoria ternatea TaxID=43366 RepID=A0AAN9PTT8_CLITE
MRGWRCGRLRAEKVVERAEGGRRRGVVTVWSTTNGGEVVGGAVLLFPFPFFMLFWRKGREKSFGCLSLLLRFEPLTLLNVVEEMEEEEFWMFELTVEWRKERKKSFGFFRLILFLLLKKKKKKNPSS